MAEHFGASPLLLTSFTGGYWVPLVILQQKSLIFFKVFLFLSSKASLSFGGLFNKLSFIPILYCYQNPSQKLVKDYMKPSQPVHFPTKNTFLIINVYLRGTEKMSCFGFQRPKVPEPEKRTETELLRYSGVNTGKGRNLA